MNKCSALVLPVLVLSLSIPPGMAQELVIDQVPTARVTLETENGFISKASAVTSVGEIEFIVSQVLDSSSGTATGLHGSWRLLDNPAEVSEVVLTMLTDTTLRVELAVGSFGEVVYDFNTATGEMAMLSDSLEYDSARGSFLYQAGLELAAEASLGALGIGSSGDEAKAAASYVVAGLSQGVFNVIGSNATIVSVDPSGNASLSEGHYCWTHTSTHMTCRDCCSDKKSEGVIACGLLAAGCGIFGGGPLGAAGCGALCAWGVEAVFRRCRNGCDSKYNIVVAP